MLDSFLTFLRYQWQRLRSFILSRKFVYVVAALVALFLMFNYVIMPWYVYHGGTLTVPDVLKMQFADAEKTLDDIGLVPVASDTILDNNHPVGAVISQNPRPGAVVKYGRRIYLTVCGGEVLVAVPTLRGRSVRDALFALERNGLKAGEVIQVPSDSSPVNTIMSQTIPPGERVKKGTQVGITVSTGSLTRTIEVPNLEGKSLADAEKILEYFGLALGKVAYQLNPEVLPNTVVGQIPTAGAHVDSGRTVDLFVVKAGQVLDER
jgi:serine/threonine-protein kinase